RDRGDLFDPEILAITGTGFEHDLRIKRRIYTQRAISIELDTGFQHFGRLEQGAVVYLARDGLEGVIIVPAVEQHQAHRSRDQQRQQPKAYATRRFPTEPGHESDA